MRSFDSVCVSQVPRTMETALAMGSAVDEAIEIALDATFWGEVEKHEHWNWPDVVRGYREILRPDSALDRIGRAQRDSWKARLDSLGDGGAALFISHGHATELGLLMCLGDRDLDVGPAFGHCEGFTCTYDGGSFDAFEILRVDH
jgi:hypothetical protein